MVDYLGDKTVDINVLELSQQLPSLPTRGAKRVAAASLEYPIIIVKRDGQYQYVLDGNHRLQKAIDKEIESIEAKILDLDNPETPERFKKCLEVKMKLLLENWRKYLSEAEEPITTLRIFDFDETIAHTRSETRVTAPDGSTASLGNQKEFEDYMKSAASKEGIETFDPVRDLQNAGYEIDLSDFSIVKDPDEITVVTDIMRKLQTTLKRMS